MLLDGVNVLLWLSLDGEIHPPGTPAVGYE
jgi:hypothetical protein